MSVYETYASVDAQIKELTKIKETLRADIMKGMEQDGNEKLQNNVGLFTVTKLKTWVYPEYVSKMETEYKLAKLKAENNDEATYTEKESLRFTPNKD